MIFDTYWVTNLRLFPALGAALLFLKSKCLVRRLKQTPVIHHQIQTTNEARSKNYRTDDGSYNSAKCPYVGMANQSFGKYADIVVPHEGGLPSLTRQQGCKQAAH